jgi:tripartite-type tricarboxylate transporter receptor subunit TctC
MLRILSITLGVMLPLAVAAAQDWPQRPVHIVAPYPAGGGVDTVARVFAQKLGDAFGQRFVVENKSGASGMIGTQVVAKAEPDGYTLLIATPAETAVARHVFKDMSYDPLTDLTPVTLLAWTPIILAAHPSLEASTLSELITLARARPIDFSSPGAGTTHHLAGEYINKLQSTRLVHVPYRGAAPAVSDAVAGQVKLTISGMPPVVPFLQAGKLKAIAVTSKRRSATFPDIPAIAETAGFADFDFTNWFGLFARAGTPQRILDRLAKSAVAILQDAQVRDVLMTQAAEPVGNTPAEFRDFVQGESAKYAKVVDLTGAKLK